MTGNPKTGDLTSKIRFHKGNNNFFSCEPGEENTLFLLGQAIPGSMLEGRKLNIPEVDLSAESHFFAGHRSADGEWTWLKEIALASGKITELQMQKVGDSLYVLIQANGTRRENGQLNRSDSLHLQRLDSKTGALINSKAIEPGGDINAFDFTQDGKGTLFLVGQVKGELQPGNHSGGRDAFAMQLDSALESKWVYQFGTQSDERLTAGFYDIQSGILHACGGSDAEWAGTKKYNGICIGLDSQGKLSYFMDFSSAGPLTFGAVFTGKDGFVYPYSMELLPGANWNERFDLHLWRFRP